jgi:hypothetical protein
MGARPMSEGIESFAALLQPLDDIPVRGARSLGGFRQDSVRIPGVCCSHYRSKVAGLPVADRLDALIGETTDDSQSKRIGDGSP